MTRLHEERARMPGAEPFVHQVELAQHEHGPIQCHGEQRDVT